MNGIDEQAAAAMAEVFSHAGTAATYKVGGAGTGVPVTVFLREIPERYWSAPADRRHTREAACTFQVSEVAAPGREDSVEIAAGQFAGQWWQVFVESRDAVSITVRLRCEDIMRSQAAGAQEIR